MAMMTQAFQWLSVEPRLLAITSIVALLVLLWIVTAIYNIRRGRALVGILQEATRGQVLIEQEPSDSGFFILLSPPPEPFLRITIVFHTVANPLGWVWQFVMGHPPRLVIQASLLERPEAELLWERGRIPAKALSRRDDVTLWVQRQLDFLNYEYATRGINPNGLIHTFTDLQTRFGPLLHKVAVMADVMPEIEVVLYTAGLNPEELPPLIMTIRAMGRATSY